MHIYGNIYIIMSDSYERVMVVQNPVSSRSRDVQRCVIDRLEDSAIPKSHIKIFSTPSAHANETIEALCEAIQPGDQILVAAGDGTGNAVINAYMQADTQGVRLGFLPYGNFNDMAATFTGRSAIRDPSKLLDEGRTVEAHPLQVAINGEHYRYALLYATFGWTAFAAAIFDNPDTRRALQNGDTKLVDNLITIARMYFKTRSSSTLPPFRREGKPSLHKETTDVLAINGPVMAKIIRTNKGYYEGNNFLRSDLDISTIPPNTLLLARSAFNVVARTKLQLSGTIASEDILKFLTSFPLPIQLDGEFELVPHVTTLAISKDQKPNAKIVKVMATTK